MYYLLTRRLFREVNVLNKDKFMQISGQNQISAGSCILQRANIPDHFQIVETHGYAIRKTARTTYTAVQPVGTCVTRLDYSFN